MHLNDHTRLARIWCERLIEGVIYTLDELEDIVFDADGYHFGEMGRKQLRTRIAEQTDTGEEKATQWAWLFRQVGHGQRIYLGVPMNELEQQEALATLTRADLRALRGPLPKSEARRSRVRRALRGKAGRNVARKIDAQRGRCGICGTFIWPRNPGNAELDHIVSLANGGPDILENTRATHQRCNMVLGATDDDTRARAMLKAMFDWPADAAAAELATARAKSVTE